jgi:CAAX protease family protein
MKTESWKSRSPLLFFVLVFALSLPIWLVSGKSGLEVVRGVPIGSVVATFCPAFSAAILAYRTGKGAGLRALLKRALDFDRMAHKIWYIPAVLFMPTVLAAEYWLLRWMGSPIPPPSFPWWMPLAVFAVFLLYGLGEELGWMGYAIDPLQERWGALPASLLLGLVWSAWHLLPVVQVGQTPVWIAWQCLFWIAARVIIVWLYNNTGKSVAAAAVFHSMLNVSTYLFPVGGSFYDPRIAALITAVVAIMVTIMWVPRRLAEPETRPVSPAP